MMKIVLLLMTVAAASVSATHVQSSIDKETNPWITNPANGFEYRRHRYRLNWNDAKAACIAQGAALTSWADYDEFKFIWNTVAKSGGWTTSGGNWVGHDDMAKEGTWVMTDGSDFVQSRAYWGSREPNNWGGGEDCATLGWGRRGLLNDWKCRNNLPYICKKQSKISVTPTSVTMNKGESQTVEVVLKRPITCPDDAEVCDVVIRFTNNHVDELLVAPCGLQFTTANWNVPQTVTITAIDDFKNQDEATLTYTVVTEPLESADPVFSGLNPSDIAINRTPPVAPGTCSSTGDPHLTSFDGKKYDWMGVGTVDMMSATHRDLTVQARVFKCFRVSCNCGLAIREGGNLFTVDACGGNINSGSNAPVTTLTSVVPEDEKEKYGAKVFRKGAQTINVKFPSGVVASVRYQRWGISFWLTVPGSDMNKQPGGLCGNFDGDASNDYYIERSKRFTIDPIYRVRGNNNLFRYSYPNNYQWTAPLLPEEPEDEVLDRLQCDTVFDPPDIPDDDDEDDVTDDVDDGDGDDDDDDFPDDGGDPTDPPPDPVWPTPSGITKEQADKACRDKLEAFEGYGACMTEFIDEMGFTDAWQYHEDLIAFCVADIQLQDNIDFIPEITNTLFTTFVTKCSEFIQDNSCPDDCNGQGTCNKLTRECACNEGFAPPDCGTELNTPPVVNSISPVGCDIGSDSCDKIRLLGDNFLESPGLMCHYDVAGESRMIAAQYDFLFQVTCPVLGLAQGPTPVSYHVSVANQGTDASAKFLFTEYDSACAATVTVDGVTEIQQLPADKFCAIPTATTDLCVGEDEFVSTCSQCQPSVDNTGTTRDLSDPACTLNIFESTISVSVKENVVPAGVLALVSYTNGPFNGEDFAVTFTVDNPQFAISPTGQVTFTGNSGYDFETTSSVTVKATATEVSEFALSDSVDIVINVQDVNEAPTSITLSASNIDENSAAGTVIGDVAVADPDNGQAHIIVVGGTDAALFAVDNDNQLVFTGDANHEKQEQYSITITATDSGVPALSKTDNFLINVNDLEERPLTLIVSAPSSGPVRRSTASIVTLSIDENSPIDSIVGVLTAIDEDEAESVVFTADASCPVHITNTICVAETIDNVPSTKCTANMRISESPNFENTNSPFDCVVTATDDSDRHISAQFMLVVVDVPEAPTAITLSSNSIAENSAIGTVVGTVVVTDQDASNAYSYEVEGTTSFAFSDTNAAQIVVASPLDFEDMTSHSFSVKVTDGAFVKTFPVVIEITDVNEAPVCESKQFSIPEGDAAGTVLGKVECSDTDGDELTYTLQTGPGSLNFAVSATGEVSTTVVFDFEAGSNYQITVNARDQQLSTVAVVTITVEDRDEAPIFSRVCEDSFDENVAVTSPPQALQRPQAYDPDGGSVTYSLATPQFGEDDVAGIFAIASDGTISVLASFDFETKSQFTFPVTASDGTQSTDTICTISVNNVNDAPEYQALSSGFVNVALTEPIDSIVYQMNVVDQDEDTSGHVYSMTGPTFFAIDAATGVVTVSAAPTSISSEQDLLDAAFIVTVTLQDGIHSVMEEFQARFGDYCSPYPCEENYACMDYDGTADTDCATCPRAVYGTQIYTDFLGFGGPTCEIELDACSPNPCANGQACESLGRNQFSCGCPAGTRGPSCSLVDAVACAGVDCKNQGICRAALPTDEGATQQWWCLCTSMWVSATPGGTCANGGDPFLVDFYVNFLGNFQTDPADYAAALAELTGVPESDITVTTSVERRDTGEMKVTYLAQIRVGSSQDPQVFIHDVKSLIEDGSLVEHMRFRNPELGEFRVELESEPTVTQLESNSASEEKSNGSGDKNNNNDTVVIAIVAGVAVLMIALVVGLVMYTRRQQYAKMDYYSDQPLALGSAYARPANGFSTTAEDDDMAEEKRLKASNPEYMATNWNARPSQRSVRSNATKEDMKLKFVFPEMTRREANAQFYSPAHKKAGVFLLRQKPTTFALSVVSRNTVVHKLLQLGTDGTFKLDSHAFKTPCRTLRNVITHLTANADLVPVCLSGETANKRSDHWLVEETSRADAEKKLSQRGMKEGDFLLRQKEVSDYVLSVFSSKKGRVEHHLVRRSRGGYRVNSVMLEPRCKTIEEVVTHLRQFADGVSTLLTDSVHDVTAADNEQRGGYFDVTPDAEPVQDIAVNVDADGEEMNDEDDVVTVPDLPTLAARVETFQSAMARNKVFQPEFNTLRWYHPEVTASEAQEFVATQRSGTFLVYGSTKQHLCVQTVSSVMHCPLIVNDNGEVTLTLSDDDAQEFGSQVQPFHVDMPALIEYYQLPRPGIPFELLDTKSNPMYQVAAIERRHRLSSFAAMEQGSVRSRPTLDIPGVAEDDIFQRKLSKRTSEDLEFFKPLVITECEDEGDVDEPEEEGDEGPWMATNEAFDGFGNVEDEYLSVADDNIANGGVGSWLPGSIN